MLFRPTLSDVVIQDIHYLNDPSILIVIHYSFVIHSVLLLVDILWLFRQYSHLLVIHGILSLFHLFLRYSVGFF
jgi:hypothetical protein